MLRNFQKLLYRVNTSFKNLVKMILIIHYLIDEKYNKKALTWSKVLLYKLMGLRSTHSTSVTCLPRSSVYMHDWLEFPVTFSDWSTIWKIKMF